LALEARECDSAEARAWYHFRLGEMAFATGQIPQAQTQERTAISEFPGFELAYRALARFCWAVKDWNCSLQAAQKGADALPEPEKPGYEADAQRALGAKAAADQPSAHSLAVERLGIAGQEVGRVWLNLLPAQIWAYSKRPESPGGGEAL